MWMWFSPTDRTLTHLWKVTPLLLLLYAIFIWNDHITFLSIDHAKLCFPYVWSYCTLTNTPLLCDYGNMQAPIQHPLVTGKSIFKCCMLSCCFHLRSYNEERYWCWRPLNGRGLTVCGLSWSHSMHLLPCQSSPLGQSSGRGHPPAFSWMLPSLWLPRILPCLVSHN